MPDHRPAAGTRVGALVAHVMRDTVVDLADAIARGAHRPRTARPPCAPWRPPSPPDASAALGRTVAVLAVDRGSLHSFGVGLSSPSMSDLSSSVAVAFTA